MEYFIIDNTGVILSVGICQPGCNVPLAAGESLIEGKADLLTQRYDIATKQLVSRPSTTAEALDNVRMKRAGLLMQADYMVNLALDTGDTALEAAARTYRQALRDVTLQPDPTNIVWPVKPV